MIELSKISILESSLASLMAPSLFVEEKYKLIENIRETYISLDEKEKKHIDVWLNGRYKRFLELLSKYDKNLHNLIDFINYSFRWGIGGVILQDVEFSKYLVEPIMDKKIFSDEEISSYAYMTYGTIMFHYFRDSEEKVERAFYFKKALSSLTNSYNLGKNDYLKNRSSYFLAQLYSLNQDFSSAIVWYFKSLDSSNLVHDQFSILYSILFRTVDADIINAFHNIGKIFTKDTVKNRYFWIFIRSKIDNPILINNINIIKNLCSVENELKVSKWSQEIEEFFTIVNSYLNHIVDFIDPKSTSELQTLYFSTLLNNRGKSHVLFRMAEVQRYSYGDLGRAMLMASESNTLLFNSKRLKFMSRMILENFSSEIRMILAKVNYQFQDTNVAFYCTEMDKKISSWRRFVKNGCISGRLEEEVEFLEYINNNTNNKYLKQLVKTRLAYLYFMGTGGISVDGYANPNYYKAKEYFESIKDNPLVAKHLKHPKLSIYLDMEREISLGKGSYLFFEKKMSSKLLIVFSCAFSYNHYPQLREFYQCNQINVLFLNNPSLSWYHGAAWKKVESVMREVVFKKFKKENITTYFGSMGGYMALKVGLTYGIKTIAFNPQIDLNLWIKHRPVIATRLHKEELVHLQDFDKSAFEKTPIYLATSSSIEDVEAFKIFINKISLCHNGLFIIEKIKVNIHPGIFSRIYKENQQEAILNISKLQDKYFPVASYTKIDYQIPFELNSVFWDFLMSSMEFRVIIQMEFRVIIQISKGEIFVAGVKEDFSKEPSFYSLKKNLEALII
jgi:hypothetical protein